MTRLLLPLALCAACTTQLSFDDHCPYATGAAGRIEFCGDPAGPSSVSAHRLGMTLGRTDEVAIFPTPSQPGVTYKSVASASPSIVTANPPTLFENGFTMIGNAIGDTTVAIYDASGAEVDEVAVHVAACPRHDGGLGVAIFCGDADGNGRLAVPVSARTTLAVFARDYTPLAFAGAGSTDWGIASVAIPTRWCDATYNYCTSVIELTGVARGGVDIAVTQADGTVIDALTVDVIDHW